MYSLGLTFVQAPMSALSRQAAHLPKKLSEREVTTPPTSLSTSASMPARLGQQTSVTHPQQVHTKCACGAVSAS